MILGRDFKDPSTSNDYKDKKEPIIIYGGANRGGLSKAFLNVGGNTGETVPYLPYSDWLNPDTKGNLNVVASANYVYESDKGSLIYQLYARLMDSSPRKIKKASVYGCERSPQDSSQPMDVSKHFLYKHQNYLLDTLSIYPEIPKIVEAATDDESQPAESEEPLTVGRVYVVENKGKYYVGKDGLVCTFDDSKKRGSCQAYALGTSEYISGSTDNSCRDGSKDGAQGDIAELGVYWDNYDLDTGTVELISGFVPCATTGLATRGGEYSTGTFGLGSDSLEVPKCSSIITGERYLCPYDETGVKTSGWGLTKNNYCACIDDIREDEPEISDITDPAPSKDGGTKPTDGDGDGGDETVTQCDAKKAAGMDGGICRSSDITACKDELPNNARDIYCCEKSEATVGGGTTKRYYCFYSKKKIVRGDTIVTNARVCTDNDNTDAWRKRDTCKKNEVDSMTECAQVLLDKFNNANIPVTFKCCKDLGTKWRCYYRSLGYGDALPNALLGAGRRADLADGIANTGGAESAKKTTADVGAIQKDLHPDADSGPPEYNDPIVADVLVDTVVDNAKGIKVTLPIGSKPQEEIVLTETKQLLAETDLDGVWAAAESMVGGELVTKSGYVENKQATSGDFLLTGSSMPKDKPLPFEVTFAPDRTTYTAPAGSHLTFDRPSGQEVNSDSILSFSVFVTDEDTNALQAATIEISSKGTPTSAKRTGSKGEASFYVVAPPKQINIAVASKGYEPQYFLFYTATGDIKQNGQSIGSLSNGAFTVNLKQKTKGAATQ